MTKEIMMMILNVEEKDKGMKLEGGSWCGTIGKELGGGVGR